MGLPVPWKCDLYVGDWLWQSEGWRCRDQLSWWSIPCCTREVGLLFGCGWSLGGVMGLGGMILVYADEFPW